jgi:hypothetical protein
MVDSHRVDRDQASSHSLSNLRSTVPGPVKNTARGRPFSVYGTNTKLSSVYELEEWLTDCETLRRGASYWGV